MSNNSIFRYNYSAAQSNEVQAIRDKYLPKCESKLDELKRLDRCVQSAGMIQALSVGILGCLIFGLGMCLAMQVIGHSVPFGAFLGICGVVIMIFAYPVYRSLFGKTKEKYKTRILELASELCGETNEDLKSKDISEN